MEINILENQQPIVINAKLAKIVGLSESIVLQQMNYWLKRSNHVIEGRKWVYNTYSKWQEQISFFCESTIRRIIKKLETSGIIMSGNFNKSKKDNTKWYTINFQALDKLVKDFYNKNGKDVNENTSANNEQLTCSNLADEVLNLSTPLPENTTETNYREEEEDLKGKKEEVGVKHLGEIGQMGEMDDKQGNGSNTVDKPKEFSHIINFFNSNIHLVTPHECEKLKLLHKEIKNPELILKAMELAVENRARSFRYIEVILYNWMDLNLHTLQEVEDYINSNTSVKNYTNRVIKGEERDGNHGENKCSKWGSGQYFGDYKQAQGKEHGKYSGFKPERTEAPEFTDEDFEGFI